MIPRKVPKKLWSEELVQIRASHPEVVGKQLCQSFFFKNGWLSSRKNVDIVNWRRSGAFAVNFEQI